MIFCSINISITQKHISKIHGFGCKRDKQLKSIMIVFIVIKWRRKIIKSIPQHGKVVQENSFEMQVVIFKHHLQGEQVTRIILGNSKINWNLIGNSLGIMR